MLGSKDKAEVNVIRPWVKVDWETHFTADVQKQLMVHFDALLKTDLPEQELNESLIAQVRNILTRIPVAQQVYIRIKTEALQNHDDDFILGNELGASGERVFTTDNGSIANEVIPGLFTYKGFHEIFLNESKDLAKQTVEQRWVLGRDSFAGGTDLKQLQSKLFNYYYSEYIKRWDDLLAGLKVRTPANVNQSVEILEIVSGYDSPLRRLLAAVSRETSLTRVESTTPLDKLKQGAEAAADKTRMQKLLNQAKTVAEDSFVVDKTGKTVEKHFSRLNELSQKSSTGSAPIEQVISDLSALYGDMSGLGSTSDSNAAVEMALNSSGSAEVIARIQRQSARLPEPVSGLVKALASGNQGLIMGGVRTQLNRVLITDVSQVCRASIDGRYPVNKASKDNITLNDFGRFFSKGGIMDNFFQTHLASFVDTSRQNWRVISKNNKTVGISSSTLKQFQYAAKIRDVFFQSGGNLPEVKFELKPVSLDAKASKFWINIDGQELQYRHGPTRLTRLTWPGKNSGLVRFGFETLDGKQLSDSEEGAWALFKLLDRMKVNASSSNAYLVTFKLGGLIARYELRANSVFNPFAFTELSNFQCPNRI
jgi:type VI secretion system protein ImpL